MNREILFKGKRKNWKELSKEEWWVEGYYFCMVHNDGSHVHHFIIPLGIDLSFGTPIEKIQVEVDPETVCQYIGSTDKNRRKIFEGDIIETVYDGKQNPNYVVIWDSDELDYKATNGKENYKTNYSYLGCCDEIIVIGNIYDNPKLLDTESDSGQQAIKNEVGGILNEHRNNDSRIKISSRET